MASGSRRSKAAPRWAFAVWGSSPFALEVAAVVRETLRVRGPVVFTENRVTRPDQFSVGADTFPLLPLGDLPAKLPLYCGVGNVRFKRMLEEVLAGYPALRFRTAIHPRAFVAADARVGEGSIIFPFAAVSAGAAVGRLCHVNFGATVGHHASVGDRCSVNPGATIGGRAVIGDDVTVGQNSAVHQGVRVAAGTTVAMAAAVYADVPESGQTLLGNPAKVAFRKKA